MTLCGLQLVSGEAVITKKQRRSAQIDHVARQAREFRTFGRRAADAVENRLPRGAANKVKQAPTIAVQKVEHSVERRLRLKRSRPGPTAVLRHLGHAPRWASAMKPDVLLSQTHKMTQMSLKFCEEAKTREV
jgi:hypothetical protein